MKAQAMADPAHDRLSQRFMVRAELMVAGCGALRHMAVDEIRERTIGQELSRKISELSKGDRVGAAQPARGLPGHAAAFCFGWRRFRGLMPRCSALLVECGAQLYQGPVGRFHGEQSRAWIFKIHNHIESNRYDYRESHHVHQVSPTGVV